MQETFSRIVVHTGEDEQVIYAGSVQDPDKGAPSGVPGQIELPAAEAEHEHAAKVPSDNVAYATDEKQGKVFSEKQAQRVVVSEEDNNDYHETTLQDLQSSTMPTTQKLVILVAVLLVVACFVYYKFFIAG